MITKVCGVDWENPSGALTLNPSEVCESSGAECGVYTRTHTDGWAITGEVREDYYYWVNEFQASHPVHGKVWGNYEREVHAETAEGFEDFYARHPPHSWDYGDI